MFKTTKIAAFKDLINPVVALNKQEYYLTGSDLPNPHRTLRAYQHQDGTIFAVSAEIGVNDRFNLRTLFKDPKGYKVIIHSINSDIASIKKFITMAMVNKYPDLLDVEIENISLQLSDASYNCSYTINLGKKEVSIKRFYTGEL